MGEQGYRCHPDEIDMARAERSIRRAGLMSLVALACATALGYWGLPQVFDFPEELAERMAFATRAGIFVLLCVVVAIGMVSTGRRFSARDIGGSAVGPPSSRIAVRVAFLDNTVEQAVIAVGMYLALATLVSGDWLSLIPVAVLFFLVGRVLFLRGYPKGVEGRALGMMLTMMPTLLGYLVVLVLLVARWF